MKPFRSTLFAIALALVASSPTACAQAPAVAQTTVEIYDRTEGRVLPSYWHQGRRFVVGKPGNEYAIRVRNGSAGRLLAVMGVDGVNVISGDTASPRQSGYVLAPYESAEIAGWRTSLSRTAAFYFTSLPDSYAARTARPDNVGVIGVAIFAERPRPVAIDQLRRREAGRADAETAQPAPAAPANEAGAPRDQAAKLGTGYGRSESSYASYTRFERASETPVETIAIYYDSFQNLLAQGVPVAPIGRYRPDPFPDAGRFVPKPQ
jgi:hypothetical protein